MIWGLAYLDFGILIGFLILILAIGVYASLSVKGQYDFLPRRAGRWAKQLQFFLNFGNATDTNAAPTMASQVYSPGGFRNVAAIADAFLHAVLLVHAAVVPAGARDHVMVDLFTDRFGTKIRGVLLCDLQYHCGCTITLGLGNYAVTYSVVGCDGGGVIPKRAFYAGYNLIVAIYIMLGAPRRRPLPMRCREILILVMSVILLPLGLWKVGRL